MPQKKSAVERFKDDQVKGAQRNLIEQLFDDHYKHRGRIYQVNFIRGISFGLGSVLGATLLVGVALWLLSLFNELPLVGDIVQSAQQSIQQSQKN